MTQMGTPVAGINTTGLPTLGRYVLIREIARSNDIVWEGIDPKMNRRVAVKELNLTQTLTGQARRDRIERFFREARAAGAMNHPNIVTIHEVGEDHGRYFIAMEYLDGKTLRERLTVAGALPIKEAVNIAFALCEALSFAHAHGVVHRDVKPENVHLLTDGRVKLTDFGIARITHETQLTVAGQVFGTPSYMSPEQVLGKEIDYRSDVFSLGVMLYEMVTGRRPFTMDGDSVVTITYRIMHDATPAAVGVSPILNSVIQRATAKAPAGRYQTATEFGTALLAAGQAPVSPSAFGRTAVLPTSDRTVAYGAQTGISSAPLLTSADDWARQHPPASPVLPVAPSPSTPTPGPTLAANLPPMMPPLSTASPPGNSNWFGSAIAAVVVLLVIGMGTFLGVKAYSSFIRNKAGDYTAVYTKATDLYKDGRYEEAAEQFRQIRLSNNADPTILHRATDNEVYSYRKLGQAAQSQNDLLTAQRWFQEALKVAPDDVQAKEELDGVQKLLTADNQAAIPNAAPVDNGSPVPSATPPLALPKPASMPGAVSTNEFQNANNQAGSQAQQLLQEGIDAYNKGNTADAQRCWLDATKAGPGSQASLQAMDYFNRVIKGKDPFTPDTP
jgi:serine/threonine-protein kinase